MHYLEVWLGFNMEGFFLGVLLINLFWEGCLFF